MNVIKRKSPQSTSLGKKHYLSHLGYFLQLRFLFPVIVIILATFAYIYRQSWLDSLDEKPISAYALVGKNDYTGYADIQDVLLKMGKLKGFWGQDVSLIQEQIETLPWVKGAVVRKIWPNRLSIWVNEYQPVAVWNKTEFVTKDGTVFQLPAEKLKENNLPLLGGPDYQSLKVLEAWQQIYNDFKAKGLTVKGIVIDERGAWQVTLDNDIVLRLGRGEWKSKLGRFVTIYPQIEVPEGKKIDYIDLRYESGAAVGMSENN